MSSKDDENNNNNNLGAYIHNVFVSYDDSVRTAFLVIETGDGRTIAYPNPLFEYSSKEPGHRKQQIADAISMLCQ